MKKTAIQKMARKLFMGGFLIAMSTVLLLPITGNAQTVGKQVVKGRLPAEARRLLPVARYSTTNELSLAIGLPHRDPQGLANFLKQVYDPASPNYHHYLTPKEFTERFGPTEKDYQAVIEFAQAHGLRVTRHINRTLLDVKGTVANIENALHVTMHIYQHPTEKRLFHAPDRDPSLDLTVPVSGISGLDDYALPRPNLQGTPIASLDTPSANPGSGPKGAFTGPDLRAAYLSDSSLNGSGQVLGLLQFDGYSSNDIAYYESQVGAPSITISNVLIDGASGSPSNTGGLLEVPLDIEMAISMATNLSVLLVYIAPNTSPWEDILNQMANDNLAKQLSCSWFVPGGAMDTNADEIFQQMAAQGQSFFGASGDADAYSGLIGFPEDTPYITEVGGTMLTTAGPGGAWASETAWNRDNGIGTGGGISTQYPIPSWQTNISMAFNQGSTTMRNTPDVAFTAENVYVRAGGVDYIVGGTSCAAPMWASFTALVNQLAVSTGKPTVGFINPALEAIGSGPGYATDFHDITTGNNVSVTSPSGFFAVTGYDLCTGWGTPAGQSLINALVNPEMLVTPASGFNAIGPAGGPFNVTSTSFSLNNAGSSLLTWTVVNTPAWLDVSTDNGTLTPGGAPATVTLSLNSAANSLPVGIYNATVHFEDLVSAITQSRQFTLNVGLVPSITAAPTNQTVLAGGSTSFTVAVTSAGPCTFQWDLNGATLPDDIITTLAGNGAMSYAGNGIEATNAAVNAPYGVAVDGSGNVFIADSGNNLIRKVDASGIITTIAGNDTSGYSDGGGVATNAALNDPYSVAVDNAGNVFIADLGNNRIRKVDAGGNISTVAGNGSTAYSGDGGAAIAAGVGHPFGVAVDGSGNLFISDIFNNCIRKVSTSGIITTIAGTGIPGFSGDGAQATNATLNEPFGLAVDASGNLFIADLGNARIRKVDTNGFITTVVGNGNLIQPYAVAVDGAGNLFIGDLANNTVREAAINGSVTTVAGNGNVGYSGDGAQATAAHLDEPRGVAVDSADNLFIADTQNNRVRKVTLAGSPTFALANVTQNNAGNYTVIVGNVWGSVTSSVATLTVDSPPSIIAQPQALTVTNGSPASFTVSYFGTAPLVYQWRKNQTNLTDGGNISGSATTNLIFATTTTNDSGNYSVVISNAYGSITSSPAALAVVFPPAFISQPQNLTVTNGTPAGFSVSASGTTPLVCQWQKNQTNLADGGNISGSSTTNLLVNSTTTNDAGNYSVIISNAWGAVTSSFATLTVASPPVITIQPLGLTVASGSPAAFNVGLSGAAPLVCQWRKNGTNLIDGGNVSGSATSNLLLSPSAPGDSGNYTVVITNIWGSVTSSVAALAVASLPVITSQPLSLTVTNGNGASFVAQVFGAPPLAYQWRKNQTNLIDGGNISNSSMSNLLVSLTTTNDAGSYTVVISNVFGSVTSSVATLTVVSPPMIASQPLSLTVTNGTQASFNVAVSGASPLTYLWQKNQTNLSNQGNISGATTSNLVLSTTTTNDAANYAVIVTNVFGAVTSSVVALTVVVPPIITSQPTSLTVTNGNPASFNVLASGTSPLFYLWQKNQTNLIDGGNISGSQTTNLAFSTTATNDAGSYTVVVSNAYGSATSTVAALTVAAPPIITSQPQSLTVTNGNPGSFSVAATGATPLNYQWQKNQTNLSDGGNILGSTTTFMLLGVITPKDAGNYSVIVSNSWGSATSGIVPLIVLSPPSISSQPQSLTVTNGNSAKFIVAVSGSTPFVFQWQRNQTNLVDGGEIVGSTTTNLIFSATTTNDAGSYTIVISNALGSVTSSVATLAVVLPPLISSQPQNLTVTNGSPASFSVAALGASPLAYQWQKNQTNLADGSNISGSATTNLLLSVVTTNDSASYSVIISNAWGAVTSSIATLAVVFPPAIVAQPKNLTVTNGGSADFSVTVSGTPLFGYQWQKNHTNLNDGGEISGSGTTNLLLSLVSTNDAGGYSLIISNAWGTVTSTVAALAVVLPPTITNQPQSLTVISGGSAGFAVAISGATPLFYQWQKNQTNLADGGEISGSETTNLLFSLVSTNDAGSYSVIVSNQWGNVTSSVATLTVAFPPTITGQPQNLTVTNGNPASFTVAVSGTAPFSFQWLKNQDDLLDGGTISGSDTNNLTLSSTTTNDAASYSVIISNAWGSVTSRLAVLTVIVPPAVITQQPIGQTATIGSTAKFSVVVSSTQPTAYQWEFDGTNLPNNIISTIAGNGTTNYSGDGGAATNASLDNPYGAAVDGFGNLFIADLGNNRIRKVDAHGVITTVAGNGIAGFSGDGGAAVNANLHNPLGVTADAFGNLFIADIFNNRIRKVDVNGIITTVAGNGVAGYSGDGGAATNASLDDPLGVAVDSYGNIFIGDLGNNCVRKVDAIGIITTVAGNRSAGFSGDGAAATNARLDEPYGVAVDGPGNLFIADLGNNRIRKVDGNGVISTIAGSQSAGFSGDGATATSATLDEPFGVAVDAFGNLFIADFGNNRIRKVDTNNIITTVAGNGSPTFSGDGGTATNASLDNPLAVAVSGAGSLFIADTDNNRVREVALAGFPSLTLSNVIPSEAGSYTVVISNPGNSLTSSVVTLTVAFPPVITNQPQSVTVSNGTSASLSVGVMGATPLICQWRKNQTNLTDGGNISGSTTTNLLFSPTTPADTGNYSVVISNIWGMVTSSIAALAVVAPPIITNQPQNLTITNGNPASFSVGVSGGTPLVFQWRKNQTNLSDDANISGSATTNLLLSPATTNDAGNYTVIITNSWGAATSTVAALTIVVPAIIITQQPVSQTVPAGGTAKFSVTISSGEQAAYQWQLNGANLPEDIFTIAGDSTAGYSGDGGAATNGSLNQPYGLAIDGSGDLFIADLGNNRVRKVDANGVITTVSGSGTAGYSGDGGTATSANLDGPSGVAADAFGNLFIADSTNNRIRKLAGGIITTVAGNGAAAFSGDGSAATNASMDQPYGVAVDALGNLFIADLGNNRIRKIDTNGVITTAAGDGGAGYAGDGAAATNASLNAPRGVALDDSGNLLIADTGNNRIRKVDTNGVITTVAGGVTLNAPSGIAVDAFGNLFIADLGNNRIHRVDATGIMTIVAGNGTAAFSGDGGPAVDAALDTPYGVAADSSGNLFIADTGNSRVREVGLAGNPTLTLTNVSATDAGSYTVIISNVRGSVTSSVATLTVVSPPLITTQPQNVTVSNGSPASLSVEVSGTVPLFFQWQKNQTNLADGGNLSGSSTTNLLFSSTTPSDAGSYSIIVSNSLGSVTSSVAALTIAVPPTFITQQPTNQTVVAGNTATFSVAVSSPGSCVYQWDFDGASISGATGTSLVLTNVQASEAGTYAVLITYPLGSVLSSNATLTVLTSPAILAQPTNQAVGSGDTATFTVMAGGTAPLSYQWSFNGTNIGGATNTSLIVANFQPSQAGSYAVLVTNLYGSTLSSNALATVTADHFTWASIPSPRFVNTPFSVTIQARDAANAIFTNFNGIAVFDSTNGAAVTPAASGNFVTGVWTGTVTISQPVTNLVLRAGDGFGHVGLANPINVIPLPSLSLVISGNSLQFLWPVGYTGFVLESSLSLAPGGWTVVPVSPIQIGNQYLAVLPMSGVYSFYRLQFTGP